METNSNWKRTIVSKRITNTQPEKPEKNNTDTISISPLPKKWLSSEGKQRELNSRTFRQPGIPTRVSESESSSTSDGDNKLVKIESPENPGLQPHEWLVAKARQRDVNPQGHMQQAIPAQAPKEAKSHDVTITKTRDTVLPSSERAKLIIRMGQGITGPLGQIYPYSTQFSSCSPVVIYNADTKMCGLYHFPAESKVNKKNGVGATLAQMCKEVKPTAIYLFEGDEKPSPLSNISKSDGRSADHAALKELFKKICPEIEVNKDLERHGNIQRGTILMSLNNDSDDIEFLNPQTSLIDTALLNKVIDLRTPAKLPEFCQFFGEKEVKENYWI